MKSERIFLLDFARVIALFCIVWCHSNNVYNPQIQIFAESKTKRSDFGLLHKTKRSKNRRAHNIKKQPFQVAFLVSSID